MLLKTFTTIPCQFPTPTQENRETGRVYVTPEGNVYPSVTRVVGYSSKSYIDEWRDKVGHIEADMISARAAARGTRIHYLCEQALINSPTEPGMFDTEIFSILKKVLTRIDNVYCIERALYSDILKVAGTVDLIAEFDGEVSIIDWKTSTRVKYADEISGYFTQCSAYAVAFEERTGIKVKNIVIAMAVDVEREPLIFIEKVSDWVPEFITMRKTFRRIQGF